MDYNFFNVSLEADEEDDTLILSVYPKHLLTFFRPEALLEDLPLNELHAQQKKRVKYKFYEIDCFENEYLFSD